MVALILLQENSLELEIRESDVAQLKGRIEVHVVTILCFNKEYTAPIPIRTLYMYTKVNCTSL